tara:strand:+ start:18782 stop:19324 length:543 start_codon:yes stop_codon:yes gene_type:complete
MLAKRWEIEEFVTEDFCNEVIRLAEEEIGFEQASITTGEGTVVRINYRNNEKAVFIDPELAAFLWEKLKDDPRLNNPGWKLVDLNEQFRVYKYSNPEQFFALHKDGAYQRIPLVEESWVTLLVYLNEDFEGGETSFIDGEVKPKTGLAALMTQHNYLHEAKRVTSGTKYVLRTDVMYRKL